MKRFLGLDRDDWVGVAISATCVLVAVLLIVWGHPANAGEPWVASGDELRDPQGNVVEQAISGAFERSEISARERRALLFTGVMTIADIATTRSGLRGNCREANPLYGSNPSTALLVGVGIAQMGVLTWRAGKPGPDRSGEIVFVGGVRLAAASWNSMQKC